jgi:hypothetical protein
MKKDVKSLNQLDNTSENVVRSFKVPAICSISFCLTDSVPGALTDSDLLSWNWSMHADSDQGTDTDTDRSGVLLCEEETQVGESLLFSRDQLAPEDVRRRRTGEKDSFGSGDRADFIGLAVTEEVDCAERPDRSQSPGMSHRSSASSTRSSGSSSVHSSGQMSDRQRVESGLSSEHEWNPPAVQKRSKDAASTKADLNGSPEILVREKVRSPDKGKSSSGTQDKGIMSADENVWSARKERMSAADDKPSLPGETDSGSDENINSANADDRLACQDTKSALNRISANEDKSSAEKEGRLADEDERSTAEDKRSSDEDKSSADEDKSSAADEDKKSTDEDRSSNSVCMKSAVVDKESSGDDCTAALIDKSSATSTKKPTREKLTEVEGRQVDDQERPLALVRPSSAGDKKPLPEEDRLADPERASSGCDSPYQERSSSSSEQSRREGPTVLQALLWNRNHRNRNFLPCGTGTGTVIN